MRVRVFKYSYSNLYKMNDTIKSKSYFWTGVGILAFLIISYFIKIPVDSGINFITSDSLLGIIIFHNPFILAFYILFGISLIMKSIRRNS